MKDAPAFQFYPGDWLSSARVQMMSLEEEGAYIRLLCFCWKHGCIPSDPELISRIVGKGASTTLCKTVSAMFDAHPSKECFLIHKRLDAERKKQAEWRRKSADGGKKSADLRRKKALNHPSTTLGTVVQPNGKRSVEECLEPNGNSSSPSSASAKEERERSAGATFPTEAEVLTHARTLIPPAPDDLASAWFEEMEGSGWIDRHHRPVHPIRWKRLFSAVWKSVQHNEQERQARRNNSSPDFKHDHELHKKVSKYGI